MSERAWPMWATDPRWVEYLRQLARYYTNRGGLNAWTAAYRDTGGAAYVHPRHRVLVVSPFLLGTHRTHLWHRHALDRYAVLNYTLHGLVAHEAGHVRFSLEKPEGALGHVWNALEDERVERRMVAAHRHATVPLSVAFDVIGDHMLTEEWENRDTFADRGLLWWVLAWRWIHDHPHVNARPRDPRWAEVRPLVEAAWTAPTSEEVVEYARAILELARDEAPDTSPTASGAGDPNREETPPRPKQTAPDTVAPPRKPDADRKPDTDQKADTDRKPDADCEDGDADARSDADGSDQDADGQGEDTQDTDGQDTDDQSESDGHDDDQDADGNAQEDSQGADEQDTDGQPDGDGEAQDADDQSEGDGHDDAQDADGNAQEDSQGADEQDTDSQPDGDGEAQDADDQSEGDGHDDAQDADDQPDGDGEGQDTDGNAQEDSQGAGGQGDSDGDGQGGDHGSGAGEDTPAGGEGAGGSGGSDSREWEAEAPMHHEPSAPRTLDAGALLPGLNGSALEPHVIESMARSLCTLLAANTKAGCQTPSHSRGRFSYERHVSGQTRTFMRRTQPTRSEPVHLSVIGDRSISMNVNWHDTTRISAMHTACAVFVRASQISGTRPHLHLFSDDVLTLLGEGDTRDPAEVVRASAEFRVDGGTTLHPALSRAVTRRIPAGEHHLIVIATDGDLTTDDRVRVEGLVRTAPPSTAFLPLLIGDLKLDEWRTVFPRAQAVLTPPDLVRVSQGVLAFLRRGLWRERAL